MERIDKNSLVPLYFQFKELLKQSIIDCRYKPGERLPSVRELMSTYQLSLATVTKAINELVREGILRSENRRGIFVDKLALPIAKSTKEVMHIGLALRNLDFFASKYFSDIIHGIYSVFPKTNSRMHYLSTNKIYQQFEHYPYCEDFLRKENLSGLFVIDDINKEGLSFLLMRKIPVVLLCKPPAGMELNFVSQDDFGGVYESMKYLLSLNHARIAYITGPAEDTGVKEAIRGYITALTETGIAYEKQIVMPANYNPNKAYIITQELMKSINPPTAILSGDDNMAVSIIQAIRDMGKRVPQDVSVIGFNDTIEDKEMKNFLTTIKVPTEEIGKLAGRMLHELITRRRNEINGVFIKTKLIVRNSTAEKKV